jgi:hypothetical protein
MFSNRHEVEYTKNTSIPCTRKQANDDETNAAEQRAKPN